MTAWGCLAVNCSYSKSRVEALGGFALSESSWEEGKCHNHDTRHSPVMCRACTAFQHSRRALLTYPLPAATLLGTKAQSLGSPRSSPTSISPWQVDSLLRDWDWMGQGGGGAKLTLMILQRQQRPRGICPDPPIKQLPWRPAPPPHDARRPAGRGPGPPPPPRPPPLAAPHPKSLLVDGGTFLWSVFREHWEAVLGFEVIPPGHWGMGSLSVSSMWTLWPEHCYTVVPQASDTLPCTRTYPLASQLRCPDPCPQCSLFPKMRPHSWSSCPRNPQPTLPLTHLVRTLLQSDCLDGGCGQWISGEN